MKMDKLENSSLAICRCCLSNDGSKDLTTKYGSAENEEVFIDMLKETFNVEIEYGPRNSSNNNRLICDVCIVKLRQSYQFKQQVLRSEEKFIKKLHSLKKELYVTVSKLSNESEETSEIKSIKDECNQNESSDDEPLVFRLDDEATEELEFLDEAVEQLAKLKSNHQKEPQRRKKMKRKASPIAESLVKKVKLEPDSEQAEYVTEPRLRNRPKEEKDWTKIAERRGNGPILRANSLKLLANSTMCVFQWNKSRYRCFCCKEPFSDMDMLREHTSSSHTLENIEKKIILQQNRLVKVEVSSLYCKICQKSLHDLSNLRSHLMSSHNITFGLVSEDLLVPFKLGSGNLQCQLCSENFTVFRHLNIHMNKHFQKQVCHICGAAFSNLVFLNLHKTRSHRPLKCNDCNIEFSNRSEKKDHEISVHNIKYERKLRFPCPFCEERFFQENFRVQHLVEKHGMVRPEHKCPICCKVFITKSLCNNHVKNVHMKEKNRECDLCHMRFYTKSDVSRHRVTHTGEKNFSCTLCNNLFASKDSLRRHVKRTHVNIQ